MTGGHPPVEAPEKWYFPYVNDEMGRAVAEQMRESDALLLGRETYKEFAAHWPQQDPAHDPMASAMNGARKYVVSTTLESADWQNSTIVNGDVAAELIKLKEQKGKNISMSGSPTLVCWLLGEGLLDELNLLVHPVVVGSGRRLFEEGIAQVPLKLLRSAQFATGVLHLTYERA